MRKTTMNSGGPTSPAQRNFLTYVILNDDAPLALTRRRRPLRRMGSALRAPLDAAPDLWSYPVDAARPRGGAGAAAGVDPGCGMRNRPVAAHRLATVPRRAPGWRRRRASDGGAGDQPAAGRRPDPFPAGHRRGPALRRRPVRPGLQHDDLPPLGRPEERRERGRARAGAERHMAAGRFRRQGPRPQHHPALSPAPILRPQRPRCIHRRIRPYRGDRALIRMAWPERASARDQEGGAGDGNRTHVTSLEGWRTAIVLRPLRLPPVAQDRELASPAKFSR